MSQPTSSPDGRRAVAPLAAAVEAARTSLERVDAALPGDALPLLRQAQEQVTRAVDEAMAAVLVDGAGTIRSAGALAGLSENAVGPRLARTSLLGAYGSESGRVTAGGVERARYDLEQGRHRPADESSTSRPLRFRARRPD
ncbi:hypothetical protein [Terracoccus luteus]|uniref:Uncharacterized protein n=1 Tax=Terracoccus luteus TaxID=53356 RepID=A0A839PVM8_9MICO|nr:hypothetical protein [Terracoccus luteus]MBB2987339.1 hypothetical protein [Terracoccus luteus]MCP2172990.1 hypothetical protein [Terracoccus luteus]